MKKLRAQEGILKKVVAAAVALGVAVPGGAFSLPLTEVKAEAEEYILPDSSERLLTNNEINTLDAQGKQMAVNEIYARHGRIFVLPEVQAYFQGKSWYRGTTQASDFDESIFNIYEQWNINFLSSFSYILNQSNWRKLTEGDIAYLDDEKLQMAVNEIYARHGRKFELTEMQEFFDGKSWYQGTVEPEAFDTGVFSQVEAENAEFLNQHISQEYKDWLESYEEPVTEPKTGLRNNCHYINTVTEFQGMYQSGRIDPQGIYAVPVYVWANYPEGQMYYADFQEAETLLSDGGMTIQLLDCRGEPGDILEAGASFWVYGRFVGYAGNNCLAFETYAVDSM